MNTNKQLDFGLQHRPEGREGVQRGGGGGGLGGGTHSWWGYRTWWTAYVHPQLAGISNVVGGTSTGW